MKWSQLLSVLSISLLLMIFATACQFDLGLSDMNLPFMPTETLPPEPTATPIPTPTVPPKDSSTSDSVQIVVMADDSTVFTDKELGYKLVLPPEWLVIPGDEGLRAELVSEASSSLRESLSRLMETNLSQDGLRMLAYDYTGKYRYLEENFISNINIVIDENLNPESELQDILIESASSLEELFEGSDVIYQSIEENSQGFTYARMIVTHPTATFGVPLDQVIVMIKLDSGLLVITVSIHEERFIDVERSLKNVINSFELVD